MQKQVLHRDNWVGGARFPCAVVNIMYMQFRLQVKWNFRYSYTPYFADSAVKVLSEREPLRL